MGRFWLLLFCYDLVDLAVIITIGGWMVVVFRGFKIARARIFRTFASTLVLLRKLFYLVLSGLVFVLGKIALYN